MARRVVRFALLAALSAVWLAPALASRVAGRLGARRSALRIASWAQGRWARSLLAVLGVELARTGPAPEGARILVANHLSYLDVLVVSATFPARFVAKREIAGWPVLGWLARTTGTIFLEQRRGRDLVRVEREIARTLAAGVPVVVFPEGGSTRGARVERLHSSLLAAAVRTRAPCRAVALGYETPHDPWAPAATVCWWGGMTFLPHAWTLVGLTRIRAHVRIAAADRAGPDRKRLAAELQRDLAELFEPVRQAPIPPGYAWPELFARADEPPHEPDGAPRAGERHGD